MSAAFPVCGFKLCYKGHQDLPILLTGIPVFSRGFLPSLNSSEMSLFWLPVSTCVGPGNADTDLKDELEKDSPPLCSWAWWSSPTQCWVGMMVSVAALATDCRCLCLLWRWWGNCSPKCVFGDISLSISCHSAVFSRVYLRHQANLELPECPMVFLASELGSHSSIFLECSSPFQVDNSTLGYNVTVSFLSGSFSKALQSLSMIPLLCAPMGS